ncbi:hypothetical protein AB0M11_39045 [Streptomyces sp. NPDC051987]|uniref:hypothetical protein n=1 Tax=Streptomyces sp. NPDC051987 TaxID=3155808 RepID=UPI0034499367
MGGTMKLGKALATGVAEERPLGHGEAPELPELPELAEDGGRSREVQGVSASEEVPAAR